MSTVPVQEFASMTLFSVNGHVFATIKLIKIKYNDPVIVVIYIYTLLCLFSEET